MKIAIIATISGTGETGGAERLYKGLTNALNKIGCKADLIKVVSNESTFETIKETYLRFFDLDLKKYNGVISTKAPSYTLRHKNHVCYLMHTMRVFYDMFEKEYIYPAKVLKERRDFIHKLDSAALSPGRIKKIFTIGNEVTNRLKKYNSIDSEVLHPGLLFDYFKSGEFEDYIFIPSRLHRWKRIDLLIKAMRHVKSPLKLKIAGTGDDENYFRELAKKDNRIEFLGKINDNKLIKLYSNSLIIPFVPQREDFGYVTLEAFKSRKPVITCIDSGEPAYFVKDTFNGYVCNPRPKEIAKKLDYLFKHRDEAKQMGINGYESISHISWENVANKLLQTLKEKNA